MDCPVCRKPLIVAERDGIELDVCPWCHGLWFDAGELDLLAEKIGRTLSVAEGSLEAAASPEKPRPCPRCDKAMDKVWVGTSPRVMLDRCRAGHGLWFDHGELGTLVSEYPVQPGAHPEAVLSFMGETFAAPPAPAGSQGDPGEVKR